ncbi:MAG: S1 family peptidase, partial [Kofleriaceae bacterium]
AAALEAARIAEKIVGDLDSASGAAIVAAAAAGAAIEAVRARGRVQLEGEGPPPDPLTATGAHTDPVITVRMQRDRILRALAEDMAATAAGEPATAEGRPSTPTGRSPALRGDRESPADDLDDDSRDPVQIAAAAIQRLRQRASTDLAELRTHYHRHDIAVLLLAFVIIVIAGRVHRGLVTPPNVQFPTPDQPDRGLRFEHSTAWLAPEPLATPPPRIVRDPTGQLPRPSSVYHVAFTSTIDPAVRLEVLIDKKPSWSNIVTGLELDRRTRWGELYKLEASSIRSVEDQDWLRTAYSYAHADEKGDEPSVGRAVEYATIDREQIYVITMFGSASQIAEVERVVAPSLRVPTRSGLPLVPQTRSLGQRTYPNPVARAFDSTVMVVAADLVDGRLRARGGGSGVIVGADGSILTNYHVIHDKDGRLHDAFVIGRSSQPDRAPQLLCAGRPNRGKLQRELDLALIKCDTDLDGRTWVPSSSMIWPTLPESRANEVKIGQRLWVLGYPDAGGGGLTLSEGEVEGWTGQDGTAGRDFLKTDASITHGNSGGPVVDDRGQLVGIASAYRTRITISGGVAETAQVGSVRPLATASDLLAIAAAGWTPREGHTDVELQPSAVEAPAAGIRIATRVLDAANESPIRDALVMVLRSGIRSSAVDVNRLDDQVLAWGRSNAQGEVQLKQPVPVPGTYTVMVVARGYEPLIGQDELRLDEKTPTAFDPWGDIRLRAR